MSTKINLITTKTINMVHRKSTINPNALEAHKAVKCADVYKSWCLSNSSIKISCALYALMVVIPSREAFKWPIIGLRAEKMFSFSNKYIFYIIWKRIFPYYLLKTVIVYYIKFSRLSRRGLRHIIPLLESLYNVKRW